MKKSLFLISIGIVVGLLIPLFAKVSNDLYHNFKDSYRDGLTLILVGENARFLHKNDYVFVNNVANGKVISVDISFRNPRAVIRVERQIMIPVGSAVSVNTDDFLRKRGVSIDLGPDSSKRYLADNDTIRPEYSKNLLEHLIGSDSLGTLGKIDSIFKVVNDIHQKVQEKIK